MALADKDLSCSECNAAFVFTVGEQEFFNSRGYTNEPKRCPECRETRKNNSAADTAVVHVRCIRWYVPSAA